MTTATCTACHLRPAHNSFICEPCADQLLTHLQAAPDMAAELEVEITRQARRAKGPATGATRGREQPLPVNLAASDLLHLLKTHLVDACLATAPRRDQLPADRIDTMAAWLITNRASLHMRSNVGDVARGLAHIIDKATRMIDNPPEKRFIGQHPCGERLHAWRNQPDDTGHRQERWIQCHGCGQTVGVEDAIAGLEDRCRDQLLTLREIATLAHVKLGTVQRWADRKRILHAATNLEGVRVFRFGDALALRDQMEARKAG